MLVEDPWIAGISNFQYLQKIHGPAPESRGNTWQKFWHKACHWLFFFFYYRLQVMDLQAKKTSSTTHKPCCTS